MKVVITNKKGEVTVIEKPKTILVKEPKREVITVSANYYDEYAVKAVAESIEGIDTRLEDGRIKMQLPAQPVLSAVAITGSYSDLSDKPVLPTYPDTEAMKAEIKKDALKLVDGVYVPTKGFSKMLMDHLTGGGDTIVTYDKRSKKVKVTTYVSAVQASGGLQSITGLITAGTNITITGSGTQASPYVINSTGGGGTPGGSDTSIQWNNSGSFAGIDTESMFTDGSNVYAGGEFFHYFKAGSALTANFKFDLSGLSDLRTITVQDASGTMALLSDIPSVSGLVPYTGATANVDLGTFDLITDTITSKTSGGLILENASGGDVLHIGNGGGVNATAFGGWNFDAATANTLAYFGASKTLSSVTLSGLTLTSGTLSVDAASDTVAGKVELATIAETNTGTDATRAVTPDGLAGSYAGTKGSVIGTVNPTTTVVTGDGQAYFVIPPAFNGMNIVVVGATLIGAASSSGTPTIQIARGRQSTPTSAFTYTDVLSTRITIDASEYNSKDATTPPVIDTANDDLATGDLLRVDIDVAGTGAQGLLVWFEARLP